MVTANSNLDPLIDLIYQEARREEFPVDKEVYDAANLDPAKPILCAGNLQSPICFFARDLGKDEVKAQQPLYGAAGRLVRTGVHRVFWGETSGKDQEFYQKVLEKILVTNTVPYKPPGNKAYLGKVKERFRPFLECLLLKFWQGNYIITLGTEALEWFTAYDSQVEGFLKDDERFEKKIVIAMKGKQPHSHNLQKEITLAPLPHPSPLNQKYYQLFPEMLEKRLQEIKKCSGVC